VLSSINNSIDNSNPHEKGITYQIHYNKFLFCFAGDPTNIMSPIRTIENTFLSKIVPNSKLVETLIETIHRSY